MTQEDMYRVQAYLRRLFRNDTIDVRRGAHKDGTVEMYVNEEFLGTIYRDDEDGGVSFAVEMAILEEDLPRV